MLPKTTQVIPLHECKKNGIDAESHIANNSLYLVNKTKFYVDEIFDTGACMLLENLNSYISKVKARSKSKGILIIENSDIFVNPENNYDRLCLYEQLLAKKSNVPIEMVCCYSEQFISDLSLQYLIQILLSHQSTIHQGWVYRQWFHDEIVDLVCKAVEKHLGTGAFLLMIKTLKLLYGIDNATIITTPGLFEEKLKKLLGNSAATALRLIKKQLIDEMLFTGFSAAKCSSGKLGNVQYTSKKGSILICDDEPDILFCYEKLLEPEYNVITASSGNECVKKFRDQLKKGNKIDLVLLDYKLFDIRGDYVACKIRSLDKNDIKTVLISAYDVDKKMVDDLIEKRFIIDYIKKPVTADNIIKQVNSYTQGN